MFLPSIGPIVQRRRDDGNNLSSYFFDGGDSLMLPPSGPPLIPAPMPNCDDADLTKTYGAANAARLSGAPTPPPHNIPRTRTPTTWRRWGGESNAAPAQGTTRQMGLRGGAVQIGGSSTTRAGRGGGQTYPASRWCSPFCEGGGASPRCLARANEYTTNPQWEGRQRAV